MRPSEIFVIVAVARPVSLKGEPAGDARNRNETERRISWIRSALSAPPCRRGYRIRGGSICRRCKDLGAPLSTAVQISATIIALNEERNIARAIESLRCCEEILVVDSGSTDRTCEVARLHGARVIEAGWLGYAAQKNYAAGLASHDWILSIDADEALSEGLEAEIWRLKKSGPQADAYEFARLARYLGRWILHSGWYPDYKVRLYHREKAEWVGEFVHESVRATGSVGRLEGNLLHFTCESLTEHVKTMNAYTTLAAREIAARRIRISWARLLLDPPFTFFRAYIVKRGFQDGLEGFIIAYMAATYNFLKYAKARMMGSHD